MTTSSSPARLVARDLVFQHEGHSAPLLDHLSFSLDDERVGLVGANGCGKTTLAHLLAGVLPLSQGSIEARGSVGLLRQRPPREGRIVADALGKAQTLLALDRLLDGRGAAQDAAVVGEQWDLIDRAQDALSQVGMGGTALDRPLTTLSGGEEVRVRTAGLLLGNHALWILDEPTNHLDRSARAWLCGFMKHAPPLLVITHDVELLEQVDAIAELNALGLERYGGPWSFYKEERARRHHAAAQAAADAEKAARRAKVRVQQRREKQDQRDAAGRRLRAQGGVPKIVLNGMKEAAGQTRARGARLDEDRMDSARAQVVDARSRLVAERALSVSFEGAEVPATKEMVLAEQLNWHATDGTHVLKGVDLRWRGPVKVGVLGDNGAGKSSLMALLAGRTTPSSGSLRIGAATTSWFDQDLALPDEQGSVLACMQTAHPQVPSGACRERLAAFLFWGESVFADVRTLSGGERLRLALACVMGNDPAPQLLLLDEPTNHLDLQAREHLAQVLSLWPGALVVATHDVRFLDEIGVTERLVLEEGSLKTPPAQVVAAPS